MNSSDPLDGSGIDLRAAVPADVEAIRAVLNENAADTSLFQQSSKRIRKDLADFIVAAMADRVVGCAAVHRHSATNAEILAVAVSPTMHRLGVGARLMDTCVDRALEADARCLWLATAKPEYFARHQFHEISRFRLPPAVLARKVRLVFEQPPRRWLAALLGRHTFMQHAPP